MGSVNVRKESKFVTYGGLINIISMLWLSQRFIDRRLNKT